MNQQSEKKEMNILVCIDSAPASEQNIRWTAQLAAAFSARWAAVFVDNEESKLFSKEQQATVRRNMDLAEQLGAEVIMLEGQDVASTVADYAKLAEITDIVVGKTRADNDVAMLFEKSMEEKLVNLLPKVSVHILSHKPSKRAVHVKRLGLYQTFRFSWQDTLKMLGLLLLATMVAALITGFYHGDQTTIIVYILFIVIIASVTDGYLYSLIASIISVLIFNFFFVEPYFSLQAFGEGYPITFAVMLLVALITSALTVRMKTQARLAAERERRTEILYEINKKLLPAGNMQDIITLANDYFVHLWGRSTIFYTVLPDGEMESWFQQAPQEADASFLKKETEVVQWVAKNQKPAGVGTDMPMHAVGYYLPVISQKNTLAVIGISCRQGELEHNTRIFLRIIVTLLAMAMERQLLSNEQREILVESEREKMRSNLLRAISHDLRTPLTGILGASSVILENEDHMDRQTRDQLLENIRDDSQWLIHMVENLLSVTRIQQGTMDVFKKEEAAEEVVAEAVARIRKRFPERTIHVNVPETLLIVPMDATLIVQVIINLLENAIRHSQNDAPIELEVKQQDDWAVFTVRDHGKGIAPEDFPHLFESYAPRGDQSSDSYRGMGIGLSICKSIIQAHHGKMEAENQQSGGAVFRFYLPMEGSN